MEFWTEKIIGGKMKVTGVKTYVIENESAPRSGGGEETGGGSEGDVGGVGDG